jgi:hypothetical protein
MDGWATKVVHRASVAVALTAIVVVASGATDFDSSSTREAVRGDRPAASATLPRISITREVAAGITKLELTRAEPPQAITVERESRAWWVTSPERVRASASKVTELVENLRGLELTEVVDRGIYAFDVYGLTDAAAFHVVAWNGDTKVSDLYFGKSDTHKRFARVAGAPEAFAVANSGPGGYLGFLYTREVRSWRDPSIFGFNEGDAIAVEVTNKNGRFLFTRNGDTWSGSRAKRGRQGELGEPEEEWTSFDETKVMDLLRAFKSLSADDFGDERDMAGSGVDRAEETGGILRIKLKNDLGARTIRVGKTSTHNDRWAIKDSRWAIPDGGDGTLYVLAPWTAGWATADAGQFERTAGR